jgi:uncharacterized protein YdeI (YjbR/CyaY-like superfamily)
MAKQLASGVVHTIPADLRKALLSSEKVREKWNGLTPLARNEWVCWTISVKLDKTRKEHVERVRADLLSGKKRPCCWIGCIHRTDKKISPSVQHVLNTRTKK